MELKDKKYFYFTQNSLSTFVNCPYRFKKKYIDNVKWQQDESDEAQEKVDFGLDFHKLAERYFKGIPVYEESFVDNKELYNAYINLKEEFKIDENNQYYPEYTMRFSDGFMRLEANIDLIIIKKDGTVEIFDWKTNANLSNAKKYVTSLQTAVYMFALKKCMKDIFQIDEFLFFIIVFWVYIITNVFVNEIHLTKEYIIYLIFISIVYTFASYQLKIPVFTTIIQLVCGVVVNDLNQCFEDEEKQI